MAHEKIIGICGSSFLMILGVFNFFFKKTTTAQDVARVENKISKRDLASAGLSGFFMNTLNPGAFIFWFAASATILQDSKSHIHFYQYRIVVFAACLIFVLASDIAKVFLAGKIRTKLTPHNIHIINQISGVILFGFGVALLYGILTGRVAGH
jgi:threonine/homoserine/homoserine lactone efflux protein